MAQLIDSKSALSGKSELSLFSLPATQVAVEKSYWVEVQPQNGITDEGPYHFHMPPDSLYLDLNKNYIYMQLCIQHADGTNLVHGQQIADGNDPNDPAVAPINLLAKTFFRQVKIFLGSRLCYDSDDLYPYRSILETELNYGEEAKKTQLQCAQYFKDTTDTDQNPGFVARAALYQGSHIVEMMAPICCDLTSQERYMLNRVDLRVELYRHTDPFLIQCYAVNPNHYKIHVHSMKWYVRRIDLLKSSALGLEAILSKNAAKYPVRRVVLTTRHVEGNRRECPSYQVFSGQVPRRMVVALCDARAFHGAYGRDPFFFQPFHISEISITAGGNTYPHHPLTMDFDNGRYMRAFVNLFEALGIAGTDKGSFINYQEFANGKTIFCFDLSADNSSGASWELVAEGSTCLHMKFSQDTPATGIKAICYAEMDNLISIDRARNAYMDYTV